MKHYISKENKLFYEPSEKVIADYELVKITKKEFDEILSEQQKPTEEQIKQARIAELLGELRATDHKDLPSYTPKKGEDMTKVIADRSSWREEIRELLGK